MLEFTGERMVPGGAADALFNEHFARYRFAAHFGSRLGSQPSVLDAGCGAGYGSAEFPGSASVIGIDISHDAIVHARGQFSRPNIRFLQAACESLPFADAAFDLIVAFEVIEHLAQWRQMLCEARRCLRPGGVLVVSTPNKTYYAESRAKAGPNPFHVHEFEYAEFAAALEEVFPHVQLWTQNRTEAIAFVPITISGAGTLDSAEDQHPENAHFYLAACSQIPIHFHEPFAWLPEAGNLLRERDRHIALLEGEVAQKTEWLRNLEERHAELNRSHGALHAELEERNAWAARLDSEIQKAAAQIGDLQREIESLHRGYGEQIGRLTSELASVHEGYQKQIAALDREEVTRLAWIADLEQQIARGRAEIDRLNQVRETMEAEMAAIFASGWFQLGRSLHVGPKP